MRSNKDRKLNLGTAFRLTLMNKFVKKNLDVKIHKLCNLANTEEIQCVARLFRTADIEWERHIESLEKSRYGSLTANTLPITCK